MKQKDFAKLVLSIRQAGQIMRGERKPSRVFRYTTPDIKSVRKRLKVSQSEFAIMIGVSKSTVQNWEQRRREPEGPAKALLRVAEHNPQAVFQALHAA